MNKSLFPPDDALVFCHSEAADALASHPCYPSSFS